MAQLPIPLEQSALQLMTPDEIYARADQDLLYKLREDRRIERKPPGFQLRPLGEYFSMWANTRPDGGLILVGVEDDGTPTGCSGLSQDRLNELEKAGFTYCPDAKHQSRRIALITSTGQPDFAVLFRVYYRADKVATTVWGEAFTRLGSSKQKLTSENIRELQIDKKQIDLEMEPALFDYPSDFDISLVESFVENYRRLRGLEGEHTTEDILELRHLGMRKEGGFIPNVACALLFARDPARQFPGCKIRFLRFDGEQERTGSQWNAVKDIWIEGPLPRQIVEAEGVLDSQLREFSRLGPESKFYTAPEYPKSAWYEGIVNACVHRSYGLQNMSIFVKMFDDRLVIESPGPLPPPVTPENIYDVSSPRNPRLMEAMYYLNFVRAAHEGARRIRDAMMEMNLPQPVFEQKDTGYPLVRVTLRNNIKQRRVWIDSDASAIIGETIYQTLTQEDRRAINFVAEHGKVTVTELQKVTGRTWKTAKRVLASLETRGILKHKARKDVDRDPHACYVFVRPRKST